MVGQLALLKMVYLFAWLISHGWKYCWLICCERKILFVGWKSTAYKASEQGQENSIVLQMLAGEFPASPLENSIILQMCIRRQNVLSDAESHCSVHHGCMHHPWIFNDNFKALCKCLCRGEMCCWTMQARSIPMAMLPFCRGQIKCCIILEIVGSLNLY